MAGLNATDARIFRITHVRNVPWMLDHGLVCRASERADPNFITIGLPELIEKRRTHPVPIAPGGTLADYVPFYFTPASVMLFNIKTGYNGVAKRPNSDIAILVSSLPKLRASGVPFVFTNGHAYMQETDYFNDLRDLDRIDWGILQRRDVRRDTDDPGKLGRYQAEALAHRLVPVSALLGIACYDVGAKAALEAEVIRRGLALRVVLRLTIISDHDSIHTGQPPRRRRERGREHCEYGRRDGQGDRFDVP